VGTAIPEMEQELPPVEEGKPVNLFVAGVLQPLWEHIDRNGKPYVKLTVHVNNGFFTHMLWGTTKAQAEAQGVQGIALFFGHIQFHIANMCLYFPY
jgi:hypothetical protein